MARNPVGMIRRGHERACARGPSLRLVQPCADPPADSDAVHPNALIPLADYTSPSMPPEQTFRVAWRHLQQRLGIRGDGPLLSRSELELGAPARPDDLTEPPGCALLLRALAEGLGDWANDRGTGQRVQLLVVPPCNDTRVVETWARAAGHAQLAPPPRTELLGAGRSLAAAARLDGDGPLVIPGLEHWFLRHRNGLDTVRTLLERVAASERRMLVACDSWAWAFLAKAADAELLLPRPQSFAAFDAQALRGWFADLAGGDNAPTFRLARNGEDVLACDDEGQPRSNHLRLLAARSGGIPWVAWQLWRSGMLRRADDVELPERAAQAVAGDRRTVWIVDIDDPRLPSSQRDRALLTLQALLVHGGLDAADLAAVLPSTGEPDLLPALVASGHLQRTGSVHRVHPAAYPAVRAALQDDGFPLGAI